MGAPPLLIFDTNVLMNIWLARDEQSALLVRLAERRDVDLVVPEFVLVEFQGTARRWLREQRAILDTNVAAAVNAWRRSALLGEATEQLQRGSQAVRAQLDHLPTMIEPLLNELRSVARINPHTVDLHLRGDLRYLRGDPPDTPDHGIKDCRIFEAVLDILSADSANDRPRRVYLTQDSDFSKYPALLDELRQFGCEVANKPGKLYGELIKLRPTAPPAQQAQG